VPFTALAHVCFRYILYTAHLANKNCRQNKYPAKINVRLWIYFGWRKISCGFWQRVQNDVETIDYHLDNVSLYFIICSVPICFFEDTIIKSLFNYLSNQLSFIKNGFLINTDYYSFYPLNFFAIITCSFFWKSPFVLSSTVRSTYTHLYAHSTSSICFPFNCEFVAR